MSTSGVPDIHIQSTRATSLRAEGVYIKKSTSAHGITNICITCLIIQFVNSCMK